MFRFYDPRVLAAFIATCSRKQLDDVFGPVRRFMVEANSGSELIDFLKQDDGIMTRTSCPLIT
jgi:hypothetical protein